MHTHPIGIFDSGFGGLTVFSAIADLLPEYDYLYLGDNARAPYGHRSFETIHHYTWQCVQWMLGKGCPLIILACNTASAKALRTIQQQNLPNGYAERRVLGVIRPTAEVLAGYSKTNVVGILGTAGTVESQSYPTELHKFSAETKVLQQACPTLVPLIETGEYNTPAMDFYVKKYTAELLAQDENIDTVLLACTHYPLIEKQLKVALPENVRLVSQGQLCAASLKDYLTRHPELEQKLSRHGHKKFYTTDNKADFENHAFAFFGSQISAQTVQISAIP